MRKKVRKSLAFLLALALVVSVMSGLGLSVSAEEEITSPGTETVQPVEEEVKEEKKETGTEESKTDVEPTTEAVEPVAEGKTETEEKEAKTEETPNVAASAADGLATSNDVAAYANGWQATIKNVVQNATVAYVRYNVANGKWEWVQESETDFDVTYSTSEKNTYSHHLFLVKPAGNHLLTTFSLSSSQTGHDLYSTDSTQVDKTQINTYPDLESLLNEAQSKGYVGYCGYTTANVSKDKIVVTQTATGQKPTLGVAADPNPNTNVKPGDKVKFTVTLTPERKNEVTQIDVETLTINNQTYNNVTLNKNEDGTYTATVDYTATDSDWTTGNITLNVDAKVTYDYVLPVNDRYGVQGKIKTKSIIENTGSTTVTLAEKKGVVYTLKYDAPDGVTPPTGKILSAPTDTGRYFADQDEVTVAKYNRDDVDDPDNGGTWTFSGWRIDDKGKEYTSDEKVMMTENGITFVGTWSFTPYPTNNLTITKKVSGKDAAFDLDVRDIEYTFTITPAEGVTVKDGTYGNATFSDNVGTVTIKGESSVTIPNLPVGTYTVTETRRSEEPVGYDFDATSTVMSGTATLMNTDAGFVTITNQYKIKELTVTVEKVVTGNMCDPKDEFKFKVNGGADQTVTAEKGNNTIATEVPYGSRFTVTESDKGDYTLDKIEATGSTGTKSDNTYTITSVTENTTITFTNKKQINPPMGVITTIAPYAIMVVLAAGAGVYFVYSRRRHNG